jgi:hypothetical protein
VGSEERHRGELVAFAGKAHPDEVNVVWHEAIDRAEEGFASHGVEEEFAELLVKRFVEPAGSAMENCEGPEDNGVANIMLAREAGEVSAMGWW